MQAGTRFAYPGGMEGWVMVMQLCHSFAAIWVWAIDCSVRL